MTTIALKFTNSATEVLPTNYNKTGNYNPVTPGVVIANMVDLDAGANTGIALEVTVACHSKQGNAGWCVGDHFGLPEAWYDSVWTIGAWAGPVNGQLKLGPFQPGQTGTFVASGHVNSNRDVDIRVNGGTATRYDALAGTTPGSPVTVPFTCDASGYFYVTVDVLNTQASLNGMMITYTPATGTTITSISAVNSGDTENLTVSSSSYAATSLALGDGVVTKNLSLSGTSPNFTFVGPSPIDGQTLLRIGTVSAIATDGTTPTASTTTTFTVKSGHPDNATPVNFTSVTLTSVSDPDTIGVVFSFSPLPVVGDDFIFDSARATIDANGILTFPTGYTGVSQFFLRTAVDGICHAFTVTTESGVPVDASGGLISRSMTATGIITLGLTVRGL